MKKRVSLVTGASSGFGLEFCTQLAAAGNDLFITARRGEILKNIKSDLEARYNIKVYTCVANLGSPKGVKTICEKIEHDKLYVSTLINNAGFGYNKYFTDKTSEEWNDLIEVNVQSLVAMTHYFIAHMKKNGGGKILNVSSISAFQPVPTYAVYAASKAFVLLFSEAVRNELKGSQVQISALCPGVSFTGFQERAGVSKKAFVGILSPQKIVSIGLAGLNKNKSVIIPGFLNRFLNFFIRVLPRNVVTLVAKNQVS